MGVPVEYIDVSLSNVTNVITIAAMLLMLYALWMCIRLKKKIPGGMVGKNWNFLLILVLMFAAGYVAMPFLANVPSEILILAVAGIFFFGAVYVIVTIQLIYRIIRVLAE